MLPNRDLVVASSHNTLRKTAHDTTQYQYSGTHKTQPLLKENYEPSLVPQ